MIGSSRVTGSGRPAQRSRYRSGRRGEARKSAHRLTPAQVRSRILVGISFFLVAEVCLALYTSPWMYVREVRVDGLSGLLPDEISQVTSVASVAPKTNLLRANTRKMERDLLSLPFILSAHIAKRPFGKLIMTVAPRIPIAILENGSESWELDSYGIPIRSGHGDEALAHINLTSPINVIPGALLQAEGVVAAVNVQSRFPAGSPAKIDKIDIDSSGDLCLNMNDGVVVRFGQPDSVPAKIDLIGKIYKEQPDIAERVETIDIRCTDAPACIVRATRSKSRERRSHTATNSAKRILPETTVETDSEAVSRQ